MMRAAYQQCLKDDVFHSPARLEASHWLQINQYVSSFQFLRQGNNDRKENDRTRYLHFLLTFAVRFISLALAFLQITKEAALCQRNLTLHNAAISKCSLVSLSRNVA